VILSYFSSGVIESLKEFKELIKELKKKYNIPSQTKLF